MLLSTLDETAIGILISLHTGLRIGEVCALRWADIDLTNNILMVRSTVTRVYDHNRSGTATKYVIGSPKTDTSLRNIPLPLSLRTYLSQLSATARSEFVISKNGTFTLPRTYENRFHRILQQTISRPVHYHTLRHTFATRCIESGMDMKTLSELLGHASITVTMNLYMHSSLEFKRMQMENMINLLRSAAPQNA